MSYSKQLYQFDFHCHFNQNLPWVNKFNDVHDDYIALLPCKKFHTLLGNINVQNILRNLPFVAHSSLLDCIVVFASIHINVYYYYTLKSSHISLL